MIVVAIDIGGTFTDLVGFDDRSRQFVEAKSLTTPHHLVQGIIDCIRKSGLAGSEIDELIHGSTTAINTLIERKGAKTGLIVTRGTRDVYAIGRGNRPEAYNLLFQRHRPLVPRHLTVEVDERVLAGGVVAEKLDRASLERACDTLKAEGVEAVAVCFLHSYVNPEHERLAGGLVRERMPDAYLSLSHQILREYREFERTSTTAVNAYIGPKVGGYVKGLHKNLTEIGFRGDLSIMRSNGGLMTPEVATERPAAMMESGPVGGIIASARVGQALGIADVISFDMGGTTAKASLIRDGEPTMAPGYYVGGYASGHPVMIPMIDVVEVGAGGGSIAWLDDVGALKVGPQSAGADPGPICYRGGGTEPTITDANVVLGRLDPDNFLGGQMKLDAEGAAAGIETKIAKPLGITTTAAAQAIVDIAINTMSLAVREVSVEKGYDPRDFALVASGGAGPLHVLAIARELHIPKVIVPLFPSHFSALGMLLADERHDFIRTFYVDLAKADFKDVVRVCEEMEQEAREGLRHAKGAQTQIHLDIRYVGQEFFLSVPVTLAQLKKGDRGAIRKAFDRLYEHRYAHHSPDEPVEMVNVRLAMVGKRPRLKFPSAKGEGKPKPVRSRKVYFSDAKKAATAPVYVRKSLGAGARIVGPALIEEHGTTTVLFEGDVCKVAPSGELIIQVRGGGMTRASVKTKIHTKAKLKAGSKAAPKKKSAPVRGKSKATPKLDPVTLEVIRNALPAIANEMAADLQRTSYNMMIYEVRDFCTALIDPNGELISQNVGGVSHFVADLGVLIVDGMKRYGRDGFKPGDVIITNHQAVAGQHLNNVVIYMPYFYKGELLMFSMVRAHWIDIGGTSTGFGAGPQVADPWFEGLQLDQLKIYEGGQLNETLYRVIKDNIRFPESSLGDMKSQMAACRLAARRMDELFDKYGRETILTAIKRIFDETEQKCRNVVAQLPDGVYEASASIDDDGVLKGEPVPIHVKVTIKGSDMVIDLSGCSGERKAGINSRTLAGARVAYKALTGPLAPVNEGSFRALDIVIPEGNIMMARFPAPMAGWSAIVPTVVDAIVAALAKAMPDRVPAGHHGLLGGAVVFFGLHPETKKRFVVQSLEGGGWGGRPYEDGESGTVSVCQGDVRNGSIEGIELKCPVVVESRGFRPDSCGAGKHRGGLGIDMQVRNLVDGHWNFEQTKRTLCPPWGLWGGTPGEFGAYLLRLPGEASFREMAGSRIPVPVGASAIVRTGGGGGWGDPLERDAAKVREDVVEGLVSVAAARELYGVVLRDDLSLDEDATARLRADLRGKRKPDHNRGNEEPASTSR